MSYAIEIREAERLVLIRLEGTWDEVTMARYEKEIIAAFQQIRRFPSPTRALNDARGYPPQPTAIAKRYEELYKQKGQYLPDRVAVIMDSAVAKLQAARVVPDKRMRIFGDEKAARAWLFSPWPD